MIKGSILDFADSSTDIRRNTEQRTRMEYGLSLMLRWAVKRPVSGIRKKQLREPPNEPLHSSTLGIMSSVLKIPQFLLWHKEMLYSHNKKLALVPVSLHLTD